MNVSTLSIAAIVFASWCPVTLATSARNIGPIAAVDDIAVEKTLVGDTLAPEGRVATALFAGDPDREARLKSLVEASLRQRLLESGISVRPGSKHSIGVNVFGGTFDAALGFKRVFVMVEVWVGHPGESRSQVYRTFLAVLENNEIESIISSSVRAALNELIEQRANYRTVKTPGP